jgi:hypothetical protein
MFCSRDISKTPKSDDKFWSWLRQSWKKIVGTLMQKNMKCVAFSKLKAGERSRACI